MTFKPVTLAALTMIGCAAVAPEITLAASAAADEAPPMVRRLTPSQYQGIIADVFGPEIKIGGRFEPDQRQDGLLAVGTSHISIAVSGLTQYEAMARTIAEQVVDEDHRATLNVCAPQKLDAPDDACTSQFLARAGELLFRRPLAEDELAIYVGAAADATRTLNDFYAGLSLGLAGLLASPDFLFRKEVAEPDPDHPGQYRLDAFSKASRLSFFLWNSAPDQALLEAAKSGAIHTEAGLRRQVERMLTSYKLESGVRAYFTDMLQFDHFASFQKDANIYPNFTPDVSQEAQEQTLRTIVDLLVTNQGDYRDIFTTRETFLTPLLGSVYGVPVPKITANGAPNQWLPFEFAEGDPRGIGILAHASFVALHSHPGRSSPTKRGKAVRELLLCQKVPDPPGAVEFTVVQDTTNPEYKTARARLNAHATEPMCAGCHKITDPIGLALETFDSAAGFRTTENGAVIDTSGDFNGKKYEDAVGLSQLLHDDPAAASCVANKVYAYAAGRPANKSEEDWVKQLLESFKTNEYRFTALMKDIATSDTFYRVTPPETQAAQNNDVALAANSISSEEK